MGTERPPGAVPPPQIDGFSGLVEIGRGGFATVYRAVQDDLGRPVAVKVLDVSPGSDRDAVAAAFEAERATLGRLSAVDGIVRVHLTTVTSDGRPAIVMELMEMSLLHRIRRAGPLDATEAAAAGLRLARALEAAHRLGVHHRDIKPANVLVGGDGQVALADFGLAAVGHGTSPHLPPGSPEHAPPERLLGNVEVDPVRADLWSLGSTLHQLLTGRPPFGSRQDPGGMEALVQRVAREALPLIGRPERGPHLWPVLERAMRKEPSERFPSAGALADAIEGAAEAALAESVQISLPTASPISPPPNALDPRREDDLPTLPARLRRPTVSGAVVDALAAEEQRSDRRRARTRLAIGAAAVVLAGLVVGGLLGGGGGVERPATGPGTPEGSVAQEGRGAD